MRVRPFLPAIRTRRVVPWLALLPLLLAAIGSGVDDEPAPDPAPETVEVEIYLSNDTLGDPCAGKVFPVHRTVAADDPLAGALEALLAGPTDAERDEGYWSWFSDETEGMLRSAEVVDGTVMVDLEDLRPVIPNASTACGSSILLAQLGTTALATAEGASSVFYMIEGDHLVFYEWLQLAPPVHPLIDASNPAIVRHGSQWHLRDSLTGGPATITFYYGRSGDSQHMLCDWNGDGTRTPGVIRIIDGRPNWLLRNTQSGGPADHSFIYGRAGDRAVCGDWNGDGRQTPGVVRERADGTYVWHLHSWLRGGAAGVSFEFGQDQYPGELPPAWPVVGDWNGNGTDSVGIVQGHPDGRMQWQLRDATVAGAPDWDFVYDDGAVWGDHLELHAPIVGDWNGDGRDGPGVTRASGAVSPQWLLRDDRSAGDADHVFRYGRHLDISLSWR